MPTLGAALDFAKLEARNMQMHQLGTAPSSPVKGQLYFNTADNTLWWWDGSAWVSARGGVSTTPPATTIALGTIQLAGDLAGTATSPQIAAGVLTDAEFMAGYKDGAQGTYSLRTLGVGVQQAMPGNRTLDTIIAPAADLNLNSKKITSLATPTAGSDAANKNYVDNAAATAAEGLDAKQSVRCATTANIANLGAAPVAIDNYTLQTLDRVLVKDQTNPAQNGIYIYSSGTLARASDADAWTELPSAYVWVEQGTVNADTGWICTADSGGTLGTTAVPWTQFSGATEVQPGGGLTKTGNVMDVGAGAGLQVNADTVQVANNGITNAMLADGAVNLASADVSGILATDKGGTGRANLTQTFAYTKTLAAPATSVTSYVITAAMHGLGAYNGMIIQVMDIATGKVELPDISQAANGDITIGWGVAPTANSKYVTIMSPW
jgi:hypothetical protein